MIFNRLFRFLSVEASSKRIMHDWVTAVPDLMGSAGYACLFIARITWCEPVYRLLLKAMSCLSAPKGQIAYENDRTSESGPISFLLHVNYTDSCSRPQNVAQGMQ